MKNKRVFAMSMAALLCASSITVSAKSALDSICGQIENRYYGTLSQAGRSANDPILEGSHFIPGTAAKIYELPLNLENERKLLESAGEVYEGSLFSHLRDTGTTCVQVTGPRDPVRGTAIVNDLFTEQVLEGDKGFSYSLDLDEIHQSMLSDTKLDLKKTNAYLTVISGLLTGILFTDGKNEIVYVLYPTKAVQEELPGRHTMLTKEDLVRCISEYASELVRQEKDDKDKNDSGSRTERFLEKSGIVSGKKRRVFKAYAPPTGGETASSEGEADGQEADGLVREDLAWENIEAGYYGDIVLSDKLAEEAARKGEHFIPGTAVKIYETPHYLGTKAGLNEFVSTAEKDGMVSCIVDSGRTCVQVTGPEDPIPGTAIVDGDSVEQVMIADIGRSCRLNLDENCKDRLRSSGMDLTKARAYYTVFGELMTGVLFSDGKTELAQVIIPAKAGGALMQEGEILTKEETLSLIRECEIERIKHDGRIDEMFTDKPDPYTG